MSPITVPALSQALLVLLRRVCDLSESEAQDWGPKSTLRPGLGVFIWVFKVLVLEEEIFVGSFTMQPVRS